MEYMLEYLVEYRVEYTDRYGGDINMEKQIEGRIYTSWDIHTSKRPPRERELISNQAKKFALVNMIFIAFLNKNAISLLHLFLHSVLFPFSLCICLCPFLCSFLSVYVPFPYVSFQLSMCPFSVGLLSVYPFSVCPLSICPLSICLLSVCPRTLCLHVLLSCSEYFVYIHMSPLRGSSLCVSLFRMSPLRIRGGDILIFSETIGYYRFISIISGV